MRKINSNLVSGIIFLLLSIGIFFIIPVEIKLPEGSSSINAQTFPKLVAWVIFILSIVLIVQGLLQNRPRKKEEKNWKEMLLKEKDVLIVIAVFITYALILNKIGFILSSLALCVVCLSFYKVKNWKYYILTFVVVFLVYFSFEEILKLNLP